MRRRGKGSVGPRQKGVTGWCPVCKRGPFRCNARRLVPKHKHRFRWCVGEASECVLDLPFATAELASDQAPAEPCHFCSGIVERGACNICERPQGLAASVVPAAPSAMPTRKPNPIQATPHYSKFRLTRPGARYAVHREEDARPGAWLPDGEELPEGWLDIFSEDEARLLLPFLRVRATGGRQGGEPTTADGRLVARACKRLGLTAAGLAEKIGAHESVLSRARNGELPEKHRDAIRALLRGAKEAT